MGWLDWRTRQVIHGRRRSAIAEVKAGQWVKLVGTVVALGEVVPSPIFGRPCVGYAVEGQTRWDRREEIVMHDFALDDDTGRAIVHGRRDVMLLLGGQRESKPRLFGDPPLPSALAFFKRLDRETKTYSHIRETVIEPGQRLVVCGYVEAAGGQDPYRGLHMRFASEKALFFADPR